MVGVVLLAAGDSGPMATGGILVGMAGVLAALTPPLLKVIQAWKEDREAERASRVRDLQEDKEQLQVRLAEAEAELAKSLEAIRILALKGYAMPESENPKEDRPPENSP